MFKKIFIFISSNKLFTGILIIGIILRLIFFFRAYETLPISSDEAWPGLMAMHILKGEFPVVYWGQSYMGTFESFFQSIFIYIFGTIPFSVRVYPLLVGILFVIVSFKLADEMYNRNIALISLSLIAIPAVYISICSSLVPPDNYLATVLAGSLALLLLNRIIYRPVTEEKRLRYCLLLGFLTGLGFWIHILYIDYIALILFFMFINDKIFFFRKRFWVFVLFFAIGSLPLIIYNITHKFDTFAVAKGISFKSASDNLFMLFKEVIPVIIGMRLPLYGDNWNTLSLPTYWGAMLAAIYIIAFLYIIVSRWKNVLGFFTLSSKKLGPTEMLIAFVIISIFVFIRSERSNSWAVRYILPVFSAVPILLSYAIHDISKTLRFFHGRVIAGAMLAVVLVIQLYGNGRVYAEWGFPKTVGETLELPDNRPLIAFLDSKGISRAYAHYWISYRLTYETGEGIICAQPYDERFGGRYKPKYTDEVASSDNVAYIFHPALGIPSERFEDDIKGIGGSYRKEAIDPYTIFYRFRAPFTEIPRAGWRVMSNYNNKDAALALDGDIKTRWGTGYHQIKGMNFEIVLPKPYVLSRMEIRLGRFATDYPRGLDIEVSEDGMKWKNLIFSASTEGVLRWERNQPRYFIERDYVAFSYIFEPVNARYIRLIQTGSDPVFDWSIPEILLYQNSGV